MTSLRSRLTSLVDPGIPDDSKLKAVQEVSENLESIIISQHYTSFLETAIPRFLQVLKEGEPQFVDCPAQQLRKLVLEIIHRMPANDNLRTYVKLILSTMFGLLETENEENVLVCLRVIIELHKQFRPQYSTEIAQFLQFVKSIYSDLPKTMTNLFELGGENKDGGGSKEKQIASQLPKAVNSLKVLAELPIIVVLMYQLYKNMVHGMVSEFIPLTMNTITLQPSLQAKNSFHFNKESYVDFVAVQIKFLSFLAYIIRIYQDQVNSYAPNMVQGMLSLLRNCPQEVAHLRRELLIAARHILATNLRNRFVSCIDQLFDEELLIGTGWTTRETVRSLAYSILADLVHHVRSHLSLNHLSLAVHLFSKNVHDDTLSVSIQTMSCKLLLNLVECIRQQKDQEAGRELLMKMMEVFILKFQTIAQYQIPEILSRCVGSSEGTSTNNTQSIGITTTTTTTTTTTQQTTSSQPPTATTSTTPSSTSQGSSDAEKKQSTTILSTSTYSNLSNLSVPDVRGMVKTLVCGMKTITWGVKACKTPANASPAHQQRIFMFQDIQKFIKLLKYALVGLDIYRVSVPLNAPYVLRSSNCQTVKTKEEKEVLEHFAGMFTMMSTVTFKEIFTEMIEYLVERIQNNYALQIIPNSFLVQPSTSATFANILINFLLERMEDMGNDIDKSNLYLKLFKLVFGSVTLFAQENEVMLKPYLHQIVNSSMELANTAQEPYNYFLLLRALFRSIGGGSHDLLYQEFLPLLSNLLQGLNRLQSRIHKQYMNDLFVELCLTVPVRLSSLLPYLHMLMDPLVSALNGSQTLISQGLRTLELCVDNLQPDFLYEHIQPVRAELMQALWRTLHNPDDNIAMVAYRVLGKFGGSSRKMLKSPQKLTHRETLQDDPAICISFQEYSNSINLPVGKAIECAVTALKGASTDAPIRQHSWQVVKSFLVSMMSLSDVGSDLRWVVTNLTFQSSEIQSSRLKHISLPVCPNKPVRDAYKSALTGMFVAAAVRDLRNDAVPFMAGVVRHITMVAVVQQCSTTNVLKQSQHGGMDVFVLVEAIAKCVCSEEKELCRIGEVALQVVLETATTLMGNIDKASELPLFEVVVDKLCGCCYERAWFAKSGGCLAIEFLSEKMPLKWILNHQQVIIMALMYVLLDLSNEVSSGTVDQAKKLIDKILRQCNKPLMDDEQEDLAIQQKSFYAVSKHLVKEVISPNQMVRKQSHHCLELLAEVTGKTITEIMEPHKELLADMIPPKKHLLRHQPVNTQMALMDGNTFCTSLNPRLFSIDLTIQEHKVFFHELLTLCDNDDVSLAKLPCYKSVPLLVPLKVSGLAALAACHYLPQMREKIFTVLYKAINSNVKELQDAGKEAMRKFMAEHNDIELVHTALRPLLLMLADFRNLNVNLLRRLSCMISLFPNSFNEKMCEQLLAHLHRWVEVIVTTTQAKTARKTDEVQICVSIMEMFSMLPASTFALTESLSALCSKGEKALGLEIGSPFRAPFFKFILKFPPEAVDFFLTRLSDPEMSRLFYILLKKPMAAIIREVLKSFTSRLVQITFIPQMYPKLTEEQTLEKNAELRYQGIKILRLLAKGDDSWVPQHSMLIDYLKKLWTSNDFHGRLGKDSVALHQRNECKLACKILLIYLKQNEDDIDLLFQLLRIYNTRQVISLHFLSRFLETSVIKNPSLPYKRKIFFKFVEVFQDIHYLQELKAKILQHIILPLFAYSFEEGKVDELLGGPPNPDLDSDDNVISVFINKVINPDKPFESSDPTCILLLQLSSLLVEHAAPHIHDSNNKKQGAKLRRLMAFAWPCLLPKQCVDPATKYYGHLLLANIIAKFAIHKRIVLQVFHSLLKAHALEARSIVRQALEILTPVVPIRMEDANATLVHWTKKIIVEEGHSMAQLVHMLQLLVRHFKVYYPVRQHLVQHMVSSIQRLGFTTNATIEQRKLAVDLAEVIIKWEYQRVKEQQGQDDDMMDIGEVGRTDSSTTVAQTVTRRLSFDTAPETKKARPQPQVADPSWMLDKQHADAVMNFLLRLACQVNDTQPVNPPVPSPGEVLSKRCVLLIKSAMKQDLWSSDYVDIKLMWFDKLLCAVDQPQIAGVNQSNICTGLDLLLFLLSTLPRSVILAGFKPLQKGITTCMNCQYIKVVRYVQGLMAKLISLFPTEPASSTVACKHEELDGLYSNMNKMILEGLQSYDKSNTVVPVSLQNSLLLLKAVCASDPCYIDRVMGIFIKVLQRLHKEHINNSAPTGDLPSLSEMLQLCLDLAKNRIGSVSQDIRKLFVNIMANLIEKSTDIKLLKTVTKIVEEWMMVKSDSAHHYPTPLLRDKTLLLTKMMNHYEKKFPDDTELSNMFYDIIIHVYRDPSLAVSELTTKLEPAFLSGLKCSQPEIRSKFFEIYDLSIQKRLYDRLVHIVCGQNWEHCGNHFWVKQCIEIVLSVANWEASLSAASNCPVLPSIASVSSGQSQQDVPQPAAITSQLPEELLDTMDGTKHNNQTDNIALEKMVTKHLNFLQSLKNVKANRFLIAMSQLCHNNTDLAYATWVSLFSKIWTILTDRQRQTLSNEMSPFLCSGSHLVQSDCHPSAISAFVESIMLCEPKLHIRSCVWKYLAKTHNCWHRVGLLLEQRAQENGELEYRIKEPPAYDGIYSDQLLEVPKHETLDSLAEIYALLDEHDLWTGLWTLRASFPETVMAIWYENQGYYEQAKATYEGVVNRARAMHNYAPAPPTVISEYKLWEQHWMKCAHELGQWDVLTEFGKSLGGANPFPVLENGWRIADWPGMKESLHQIEPICPDNYLSKLNLYKGYQAVCYPDDQHLSAVEKLVEAASLQSIRQWKKLPLVVSNAHVSLLQLSQQIMELHEGAQIQNGLQPANLGRQSSLNELKTIFKTWKNRLPNQSDNLSHWSDILDWRQIHFKAIVNVYENVNQSEQSNHAMVAVHHSASAIVQYATIARQHNLTSMCLNILGKIHSIPSVPVVDCFQKIRQQIKCYLQMTDVTTAGELQEGLDVIESTNLKYFNKEMIAEFFALKGTYLAKIGRSDQANKCFSSAVQMHDNLVKAWAAWGDYLDQLFSTEKSQTLALSAMTCYLHACRNQDEPKSRKYLARILWLLTYDDEKNTLAEAVDKYYNGIPPVHWLPWIPQLLMSLVRKEGQFVTNLLCHIGKTFPQAIYFPIRTLYLTLKLEQRERSKSEASSSAVAAAAATAASQTQTKPAPPTPIPEDANTSATTTSSINPTTFAITGSRSSSVSEQSKEEQSSGGDGGPIKAPAPMWRCSRIMHLLRDLHPTLLSALEGIVDQMVWFRENWYEELLRQLMEGLSRCQAVAFENRTDVANTQVTPELKAYVHKLVAAFGIGIEQPPAAIATGAPGQPSHEALTKRAQAAAEDPAFQRLKNQFASDFDFNSPGALRLHSLMARLKKWIRILEMKTKSLQKSFLLEEKCRFLSNFSLATADVEIPGEYLMPRQMPYYVHIARFMPHVEIVQNHTSTVRRLFIRGDNGKVYPYLVVNDSSVSESRREERLLQLLRMMNMFLEKQKETCRRHLMFTVPRVVPVSPQMRLVEDDPSNVSLMDIFSQHCSQKNQEWDCVLTHYYEQLAQAQGRGDNITVTTLQDLFYQIQSSLAPPTIMKEWAMKTFPTATDYWTFRRQVTQQLALTGLIEFVLHLTRLDPDMFKISRDSGCLTQAYFKFDIKKPTGELDANRSVPFRFTPSLQTFVSTLGKTGLLTMCMLATARCLAQPYFSIQSILRAILRDEYISWYKKQEEALTGGIVNPADINGDIIVKFVTNAVTAIMTRLQSISYVPSNTDLAQFEGAESNIISQLISAAENVENLCRMDPAWNAWI